MEEFRGPKNNLVGWIFFHLFQIFVGCGSRRCYGHEWALIDLIRGSTSERSHSKVFEVFPFHFHFSLFTFHFHFSLFTSEKWKVEVKSEKWKVKVKRENFENLRVWSLACWASNQINQSSLVTIAPPAATSNENLEQMEENSAHQIVFRSSKFLHHLQTVLNRFMRPIEQVSRDKPDVGKNILLLSAWESIQPLPSLFWGRISPFQSPELNTPCPTVPPHI